MIDAGDYVSGLSIELSQFSQPSSNNKMVSTFHNAPLQSQYTEISVRDRFQSLEPC